MFLAAFTQRLEEILLQSLPVKDASVRPSADSSKLCKISLQIESTIPIIYWRFFSNLDHVRLSLSTFAMSQPHPHALALISLKPLKEHAHNIIINPNYAGFVSRLPDNTLALDVGHIHSQSHTTLASFGQHNADIVLQGKGISRLRCSFESDDLQTGIVCSMIDQRARLHKCLAGTQNLSSWAAIVESWGGEM